MTKYILCGGVDKTDTFEDRLVKVKDLYNEIISGTPENIKILLCTFAKKDKDVLNRSEERRVGKECCR